MHYCTLPIQASTPWTYSCSAMLLKYPTRVTKPKKRTSVEHINYSKYIHGILPILRIPILPMPLHMSAEMVTPVHHIPAVVHGTRLVFRASVCSQMLGQVGTPFSADGAQIAP